MPNTYDKGDTVRLSSIFTVSSVDTDPTDVTLKYQDPSSNETTVTGTTRSAAGRFYYDLPIDESGQWWYRFEGTGAVQAASETSLLVRRSEF